MPVADPAAPVVPAVAEAPATPVVEVPAAPAAPEVIPVPAAPLGGVVPAAPVTGGEPDPAAPAPAPPPSGVRRVSPWAQEITSNNRRPADRRGNFTSFLVSRAPRDLT